MKTQNTQNISRHSKALASLAFLAALGACAIAQQGKVWGEAGMKAVWNQPVAGGTWLGWNDWADAVGAGKSKNVNGGAANFTGSHPTNQGAAVTLGNWTVKDGGPVPGWGFMGWRKFPNNGGRTMSAAIDITDAADNTKIHGSGKWTSTVTPGVVWDSYDWKGSVSASITRPDNTKPLGDGRVAGRAHDPMVFQILDGIPFDLDITLEPFIIGCGLDVNGFAEINWHAAFGRGQVVGQDVLYGSMTPTSNLDGLSVSVNSGQTLSSLESVNVLSVHTMMLDPGYYWFDCGVDIGLAAVPEPAPVAATAIGLIGLLGRRKRIR